MLIKNLLLATLILLINLIPSYLYGQDKAVKDVLLLGTYHFVNSGSDTYNLETDDYLSPERQKEILELNENLSDFQPNKIFLEISPNRQPLIDSLYTEYKSGRMELTELRSPQNEIYQIGFKLAKMLGHNRVYAVDAEGYWLKELVDELRSRKSFPELDINDRNDSLKNVQTQKLFKRQHIIDNLAYLNSPAAIRNNHAGYNPFYIMANDSVISTSLDFKIDTSSQGREQIFLKLNQYQQGAELVAEWYRRNIKIFSKIDFYTEESDERILVVFGQGHIRILDHLFSDHPDYNIINPLDYLQR